MKTKFIKKLSFVLVVAMVLSLLVPATGAFAASAKLNSTKKYLHLGREESGENEFNFNVKNKQKGWKYAWESNDEDVVEVNAKNGVVTATGVGKTKVTVLITDEDGEEVDTLSATVTVRDNIETVAVKNPVEKLTVNEEHDYNRSFETESGSTKKTDSITRWEVVPAEGASIDDKGVFVATAAGEYTITARSFQSKARYNAWDDDAEKYADYVLATAETKVVVGATMVEAKQIDLDTFEVTFDSAVTKDDLTKNLVLTYLAGTTPVNHQIKEVKLDDTNKVATVDVYSKFVEKATYVVAYPDMESLNFVAATTDVKDVVRAAILTHTVQIAVEEEIKVGLYNVNGVNIADTDLLNRVEMKSSNNASYMNGRKLSMYKVGDTTNISIIYHTYEYDLTTGLEVGTVTTETLVTCVEKKVDNYGLLNAYTVVTASPSFSNVKHKIAADDTGLKLFVQLKGKMANGWQDKWTDNTGADAGHFKFTSSNPDVLIVSADGYVYPVKEGSVSVVVTFDDVVVGSAAITVVAKRKVANIEIDSNNFVLSNHAQVQDNKTVTIKVKDNLDDTYTGNYTIETKINTGLTNSGTNDKKAGAPYTVLASGSTTNNPVFVGTNAPAQQYTYTVTVTDVSNGYAKMSRYISVNVAQPSSDTVDHYKIEASKSVFDMKLYHNSASDNDTTEDVTLSIFGYAANGVRNRRVNVNTNADSGGYDVKVKSPHGKEWTNYGSGTALIAAATNNATFSLVTTTTDSVHSINQIYAKEPTGVYLLEAKDASGKAINATYFEVKDTQGTPSLKVNKLYTDKTTVFDAVKDCFDFNLNGSDLGNNAQFTASAIVSNTAGTAKSEYIKEVYVYQLVGATYIKHKVAVNTVIHYAQ